MPACPFCKATVRADLLRYGGHCPKCMIAIPGEETPTDPGERARVLQELEEQVAKSKHRGAFMAAAAAMGLLLGGAGAYWYQNREEPTPAVAESTDEEIYIVPLSAHRDLVLKSDGGTKSSAPRAAQHRTTPRKQSAPSERELALAEAPATGGSVEQPSLEPIEGSLGSLDATLGALGPNVKRADIEGIVLSDPAQINSMVKRVMSKGQGQLVHCYESRLKADAKLKGRWNVQFQIEPTGHASSVTVVAVDSPDSELETCIERNIVGWDFLKINEPLVVQKVYRFGPGA